MKGGAWPFPMFRDLDDPTAHIEMVKYPTGLIQLADHKDQPFTNHMRDSSYPTHLYLDLPNV